MGATEYQLMSVMGWTKPDMARVYIEKANRGKMAASAIRSIDKAQINQLNRVVTFKLIMVYNDVFETDYPYLTN